MLKAPQAVLFGIIALLAPWGAAAHGQDPYGLGYGYLFGYGATNTPAIRSFVPAPPYFALHPPVYYGQRYTRPYGDSPFASWPQLQPSAGYKVRPAAAHALLMANPYAPACCLEGLGEGPVEAPVDAPAESPVVKQLGAVRPLVIDNPYYAAATSDRLVATAEGVEAANNNE